ncbi:MAG: ECF transporter S component [Anaerovoracaceae bacterium]
MSRRNIVSLLIVIVFVPATLVVSWALGDRRFYICGLLIIAYAMIPFFVGFERRRPQAREMVSIAVLCAIAVVSRAAFVMLPQFKPMTGIVIISGMAFGPSAGFLTGAVSGFVSNFIFGQGPWTPWQMFAFGVAGFIGGLLKNKGLMKGEKRFSSAVLGGLIVMLITGPILDTCTLFTMSSVVNAASAGAIYLAGVPFNAVHAAATALTILLLGKPMLEKLERIRIKYGLMEEGRNEV